jgi:hypothetical protein
VAQNFADAAAEIYKQAGRPKAGCELDKAERAVALAREELDRATDRVQKLDSSATDLESATQALLAATTSLASLEGEQKGTESKFLELGILRLQEAEQSHAAKNASDRHGELESANRQVLAARAGIAKLEETLKPLNEEIAKVEKSRVDAKNKASAADKAYRTATDAVQAARRRHELASAHSLLFEKAEILAKLSEKDKKVAKRRGDVADLEKGLAKLPKVDKAKLRKLQTLELEWSKSRAALQAMAAGLEVVAADKPVKAGGQTIKVGHKQILTEDTEVRIGSSIRLRIQPGGGTNLADARKTEAEARKDLQAVLDAIGLQTVLEAADAHARRDQLSALIEAAQAELEGMGVESLAEELKVAENDLIAAKANAARLAALAPDLKAPDDKTAAKALAKALGEKLSAAEGEETKAKATSDRCAETLESAEKTLEEKRTEAHKEGNKLTGLKAQMVLLLLTHGDDTVRTHALTLAQSDKTAAQNLHKTITDAIAALQPDLLEGDAGRIKRAIEEKTNERDVARTQIAVAQAALHSDGSEDPQAALATAEAKARSASEYWRSVQRKSQAVALLHQLFQEEQRSLAKQFTQPLADKISGYLQCIFGAGARAQVSLENNEFTSLLLSRPGFGGASFAFDTLSGGAKEQTAAAVRLAMAEVLATYHGGCLPVVLDDAFAYCDLERVNQVQRMLDLAASRGLQIIILTCNPSDYAALGAHQILLRPERATPANQPMIAAAGSGDSPSETGESESTSAPTLTEPATAVVSVTDEQRDQLLSRLGEQGGKAGNASLREALGWDEATYNAVKADLIAAGRLIPGKGRGGSVALPAA